VGSFSILPSRTYATSTNFHQPRDTTEFSSHARSPTEDPPEVLRGRRATAHQKLTPKKTPPKRGIAAQEKSSALDLIHSYSSGGHRRNEK